MLPLTGDNVGQITGRKMKVPLVCSEFPPNIFKRNEITKKNFKNVTGLTRSLYQRIIIVIITKIRCFACAGDGIYGVNFSYYYYYYYHSKPSEKRRACIVREVGGNDER